MTEPTMGQQCRDAVEALRRNILKIATAKKPRVLVVDDSSTDADLLRHEIEAQCVPCDITSVGSCEEAYDLLRRESFDLVFLDLVFPQMNGWELLNKVGSETERIPFIALSGSDVAGEEMQKALYHGAKAIFRKEQGYPMLRGICGILTAA